MLQFPVSNSIIAAPGSSRSVDDTTFERIRQHKVLREQLLSLWEAEELAVAAAEQTHGDQPFSLISWRNYSAIGGSEIERVRDEFIMLGIPPDVVEREYLDAKRRYQKQKAKRRQWAKKAGVHEINQKWKAVLEERNNVMQSFVDEPPVTPKATSALIFYILEFYDGCEFDERACNCLEAVFCSISIDDRWRGFVMLQLPTTLVCVVEAGAVGSDGLWNIRAIQKGWLSHEPPCARVYNPKRLGACRHHWLPAIAGIDGRRLPKSGRKGIPSGQA